MKFWPVVSSAGLGTDEPAANELAYDMICMNVWHLVKRTQPQTRSRDG